MVDQEGGGRLGRDDEEVALAEDVLARRAVGRAPEDHLVEVGHVPVDVDVLDSAHYHVAVVGDGHGAGQRHAGHEFLARGVERLHHPQIEGLVGGHLLEDDGRHGLLDRIGVDSGVIAVDGRDVGEI